MRTPVSKGGFPLASLSLGSVKASEVPVEVPHHNEPASVSVFSGGVLEEGEGGDGRTIK